jgi:hypothetical protein
VKAIFVMVASDDQATLLKAGEILSRAAVGLQLDNITTVINFGDDSSMPNIGGE